MAKLYIFTHVMFPYHVFAGQNIIIYY